MRFDWPVTKLELYSVIYWKKNWWARGNHFKFQKNSVSSKFNMYYVEI